MERSQGRRGPLRGFTRRLSGLFVPKKAQADIEERELQRIESKKLLFQRSPEPIKRGLDKRKATKVPARIVKARNRRRDKMARASRRRNRVK